MKNIAFLINNIDNGGGTERVTSMICNELSKNNKNVTIISCYGNGKEKKFQFDQNIKIEYLNGNKLFRKIDNLMKIYNLIKKYNIEVIIAVDVALYLYILPFQVTKKIKGIAWEHFNYFINTSKLAKLARKLAIKHADQIIVLSNSDLNNYKRNNHKMENIRRIYNPNAIEKENINLTIKNKIIAVGRLEEQKGFDMLIEAWRKIYEDIPKWQLNIYGDGSLKEILCEKIKEKKIRNIEIRGFDKNIKDRMKESDLFVLSSRYEGFGLVLIEAQSMGLACVSFNCPEGPSEIISNNINGYLIENGNINELANKIKKLCNDTETLKKFKENSQISLNKFETKEIIQEWLAMLEEI